MKRNYTNAVLQLVHDGVDIEAVLEGLRRTMKMRGHIVHYKTVLQSVLDTLQHKEIEQQSLIQVASNKDVEVLKEQIAEQLSRLGAPDSYRVAVCPELIGGSRIVYNHTVLDASYKAALLKLYNNVVRSND